MVKETWEGRIGKICSDQESILVIVLEETVIPKDTLLVMALSNEVELRGNRDMVLYPKETGLAYEVIAQTDISFHVPTKLFGRLTITPKARLTQKELLKALHTRTPIVTADRSGPPVYWGKDPRWRWKLSELERFNRLVVSRMSWEEIGL